VLAPDAASQRPWTRTSAGTPSSSTGPLAAHDGTFYLFTEASGQYNKEHLLDFVHPLDGGDTYDIEIWYHMHGVASGSLSIEMVAIGSATWTSEWSVVGEQQPAQADSWVLAVVTVSPAVPSMLRINGVTGSAYHSDMCDTSNLA